MMSRKVMIGLSIGALIAGLSPVAGRAGAPPERGWAHAAGVVNLGPNRTTAGNVADHILIEEALSRWGIAYDEGRLDVIGGMFVDTAEFLVLNGSAEPVASARGRDEIVKAVGATMKMQGDQRRHLISNFVIDVQAPHHARMIAYALVAIPGDVITLGATVVYSCELEKGRDGAWRFTKLVIAMDRYDGEAPRPTGSK